jgi:hypothetical protein
MPCVVVVADGLRIAKLCEDASWRRYGNDTGTASFSFFINMIPFQQWTIPHASTAALEDSQIGLVVDDEARLNDALAAYLLMTHVEVHFPGVGLAAKTPSAFVWCHPSLADSALDATYVVPSFLCMVYCVTAMGVGCAPACTLRAAPIWGQRDSPWHFADRLLACARLMRGSDNCMCTDLARIGRQLIYLFRHRV